MIPTFKKVIVKPKRLRTKPKLKGAAGLAQMRKKPKVVAQWRVEEGPPLPALEERGLLRKLKAAKSSVALDQRVMSSMRKILPVFFAGERSSGVRADYVAERVFCRNKVSKRNVERVAAAMAKTSLFCRYESSAENTCFLYLTDAGLVAAQLYYRGCPIELLAALIPFLGGEDDSRRKLVIAITKVRDYLGQKVSEFASETEYRQIMSYADTRLIKFLGKR